MDFNETFRSINKKISRDDYCYLNETNDLDLNIFSNFGVQLDYDVDEDDEEEEERESEDNLKCNSIGLDDFRKVLILHFIGKFFRKKYRIENKCNDLLIFLKLIKDLRVCDK